MLKKFLNILKSYNKTGATMVTFKIYKVNMPYVGLKGL